MHCYILHIYRQDPLNPENIAGIVEIVESDQKIAIKNIGELTQIIIRAGNESDREAGFYGDMDLFR
ncbi:MAG: hypothetical protein HKM93_01590 [Desulfobacteraceae bacterium]|nr:hypothetical protein [Desulfobacteraceae bacterium]